MTDGKSSSKIKEEMKGSSPPKKKETKWAIIAIVVLVILLVTVVAAWFTATYYPDVFTNLFAEKKPIKYGDYADVHYIGKYASNDTIFESSYTYPENKTGGTPIKVFVTTNMTATPATNFSAYSNRIGADDYYVPGFIEGLVGLKKGDSKKIGPLAPEKAYGVKPVVGTLLDLSTLALRFYTLRFVEIQENAIIPADFEQYLGTGTTTLYTLREDFHDIGEVVDQYPAWPNATIVTQINQTMIWMEITPPYAIGVNFTWNESDSETQTLVQYPENASSITSINNTTLVITHTPQINTTIGVFSLYGSMTYTVENVTTDKIITYYRSSETSNKTYQEMDRTTTIERNQTKNITLPPFPPEIIEGYLLAEMRNNDPTFTLSLNKLAGETVYFEVYIDKVYNVS